MEVQELKDAVIKLLVAEHEFLIDDAETAVTDSYDERPELWTEKADANDLAKFLASDGDDD